MKIQELRQRIAQYQEDDLRLLVIELYRRIPKEIISSKHIDDLLVDPHTFLQTTRQKTKQPVLPEYESLAQEIEDFLDDANEGLYFKPNRHIHKKDRPKWRFLVKRFHRDLMTMMSYPEHASEVSLFMEKLYETLCQAEQVYLFPTQDPFASVGVSKDVFYANTVKSFRVSAHDFTWVHRALDLLTRTHTYGLDQDLIDHLLQELDTAPLKERSLQDIDDIRQNIPPKKKNEYFDFSKERKYFLDALALSIHFELGQYEQGIADYHKHSVEFDQSQRLNSLLTVLEKKRLFDFLIREYENAIKMKIKPYYGWEETYQALKSGEIQE